MVDITPEQARLAHNQATYLRDLLFRYAEMDTDEDRADYLAHAMQHAHRLASALGFTLVRKE